ncbi:MAG: hypothetical protein LCH37_08980 [Bacteroidetes bacterium]|nr:hypothetical protein [Bacteroidota bacterium]
MADSTLKIVPTPFSNPFLYLDPCIWIGLGSYKVYRVSNPAEFSFWIGLVFVGIGMFRMLTQLKSFHFSDQGIVVKNILIPGKWGRSFFPWGSIQRAEFNHSVSRISSPQLEIQLEEKRYSWYLSANRLLIAKAKEICRSNLISKN